ncbi:hypothetical protein IFM89_004569 [Coptis chinensis]|uniref:RRM domain-containing protein n=1 Tax=Coptis chinensis TaxID=261450 RepID=A0A835H1D1_9MAGN|nr:hypothetical protein IFM89_004569 [Coptis chinensis]
MKKRSPRNSLRLSPTLLLGSTILLKQKKKKKKKKKKGNSVRLSSTGLTISTKQKKNKKKEEISICFLILTASHKYRWYEIDPNFTTSSNTVDPTKLCRPSVYYGDISIHDYPFFFSSATFDSKIYLIGGNEKETNALWAPSTLYIPSSSVNIVDTRYSSTQNLHLTVGTRMYGGKSNSVTVEFGGKIFVIGSSFCEQVHAQPWAEVYDPEKEEWEDLPCPSDRVVSSTSVFGRPNYVVYEKKNKLLILYRGVGMCSFDLVTKSWEYGLKMPRYISKKFICHGRHVIVNDVLYMFCKETVALYAYDFEKGGQDLIKVPGLESATRSVRPFDCGVGQSHLFHLGNQKLCLVWPFRFYSGFRIICLKFHVVEDGVDKEGRPCLRAIVDQSDYYFIEHANDIMECFPIQRAAHSDTGPPMDTTVPKTTGTSQVRRHARRVYVDGFSSQTDVQAITIFFNSRISGSRDPGAVLHVYLNKQKSFAIVELRSEEEAIAALELDCKLFKEWRGVLQLTCTCFRRDHLWSSMCAGPRAVVSIGERGMVWSAAANVYLL